MDSGMELPDDLLGDVPEAVPSANQAGAPETTIQSAMPLADELFDEDFANANTRLLTPLGQESTQSSAAWRNISSAAASSSSLDISRSRVETPHS